MSCGDEPTPYLQQHEYMVSRLGRSVAAAADQGRLGYTGALLAEIECLSRRKVQAEGPYAAAFGRRMAELDRQWLRERPAPGPPSLAAAAAAFIGPAGLRALLRGEEIEQCYPPEPGLRSLDLRQAAEMAAVGTRHNRPVHGHPRKIPGERPFSPARNRHRLTALFGGTAMHRCCAVPTARRAVVG